MSHELWLRNQGLADNGWVSMRWLHHTLVKILLELPNRVNLGCEITVFIAL